MPNEPKCIIATGQPGAGVRQTVVAAQSDLCSDLPLTSGIAGKEHDQLTKNILSKLIEHNNWANRRVLEACSALTDEQLDATPLWVKQWSIRRNLAHLMEAQHGYLSLLTLPPEARTDTPLSFPELGESASSSGDGLLALAEGENDRWFADQLRTKDGYRVDPWVVIVQAVNHGAEHRKQICILLRALGIDPPQLDGWAFGEAANALVPTSR